jgi:hypothetical protein
MASFALVYERQRLRLAATRFHVAQPNGECRQLAFPATNHTSARTKNSAAAIARRTVNLPGTEKTPI